MPDIYAVVGNPIAHSRSPMIHQHFAQSCGEALEYKLLYSPVDEFESIAADFFSQGGKGLNVTVPFKERAFQWADRHHPSAILGAAVNTLWRDSDALIWGANTDGPGLQYDLQKNAGYSLQGKRILMVGAGGAARGVAGSLIAAGIDRLTVLNRTVSRAQQLVASFAEEAVRQSVQLTFDNFDHLAEYDLVINATSASLSGEVPALNSELIGVADLVYDMMYAPLETPFLAWSRNHGAERVRDGLGMLVEQAAEAFYLWRGIRPETRDVLTELREVIRSQA